MFYYGMRSRGMSPGAQPKGIVYGTDDPTGKYYSIIAYSKPLSAQEITNYELDFIKEDKQ